MFEVIVIILILFIGAYLGGTTWIIRMKDREIKAQILMLHENLENSKNWVQENIEMTREQFENTQGFDVMEMIQMQRAQLVTNLLEFGVGKLAQKFGGFEAGIHQIQEPRNEEEIN